MAALNDFKTFMAAKLGQILRKEIGPSEISLGVPTPAVAANKRIMHITYQDNAYPVIYSPFDIARLFGQSRATVKSSASTVVGLVADINARYAIGLTPADVVDGPVTAVTVITISDTSVQWRGTLTVTVTP